jgi:hypothetical protein
MSTDSERQKARERQRKLDAKKREKRIPPRAKIREYIEKRVLELVDLAISEEDAQRARNMFEMAVWVKDAIINEEKLAFDDSGIAGSIRWDPKSTRAEVARIFRVRELKAVIAAETRKEG